MIIRFANVIYWLAAAVSAVLMAFVAASLVFGHGGDGRFEMPIIIGIVAVLIWFAGRAIRYVLAGHQP